MPGDQIKPLCFVLMPFGKKKAASGQEIDFDAVYEKMIRPAIEKANLEPLRADEEKAGGIIHKPMFERLLLCDYAVADMTTANANVFYELGVRHATRPYSTVLLYADGHQPPFDVGLLRHQPYRIDSQGQPENVDGAIKAITAQLGEARNEPKTDSPLYQLLGDPRELAHEITDSFRKQVTYSKEAKAKLEAARKERSVARLKEIEASLGDPKDIESGVAIDLFLSYRAVEAWDEMIHFGKSLSRPLLESRLVQQQLAFALNRAGRGDDAEKLLKGLIAKYGADPETNGLLGRIYKDRWKQSADAGDEYEARAHLEKAIDTYHQGFQADWRDAYPGVNAVTLMEIQEPPDERRHDLLPVVTYSVRTKIGGGEPDYWDWATLLELAVLRSDEKDARDTLGKALVSVREVWEPKTTLNNLRLIHEAREKRGTLDPWLTGIEEVLQKKADALKSN